MDSLLYYEICFLISVLLSFTYICLWHDGINVYMTCLFILLPIVCLGCVWMYWAPNPELAIVANKLVYLAGCFWPLIATGAILSLCNLKIRKPVAILAFALSFLFYGFALTSDRPGALYTAINWVSVDGRIELYPEYGWMHTVIYASMALYVLVGVVALIYGMKNKVRASIKNMRIMLIGEFATMIVFFFYGFNKFAGSPAFLYVLSQAIFLFTGYRSYYYNTDSSVMDTVIAEGKLGFMTFDTKCRVLGCNEAAELYFPELKTTRTDLPLDNMEGVKKVIADCLEEVREKGETEPVILPSGEKLIRLSVDRYSTRGRKDIYRVIMEDDTDHQKLIALLNREKDEAEQETRFVSDTLHRYLDPSIADTVLNEKETAGGIGSEKNIAVMFADIRGFTSFSENRSPKEVLAVLNTVIETVTGCIMNNGGIVDKIIGDCVMGVWTGPDSREAVLAACRAALEIRSAGEDLKAPAEADGETSLRLGIGINFGPAIVGNVGMAKRMDYTAIGDTVNVASRLEGIAGPGEILVTEDTAKLLDGRARFSLYNSNVVLRGRSNHTYILKLESLL